MNEITKKFLRHYFPNISRMRKWMSNRKIKEIETHFMDHRTVCACEEDDNKKYEEVQKFVDKHASYSAEVQKKFDEYLKEISDFDQRKYMEEHRIDVMFCCFAYGFAPDEYFFFGLEKKKAEERREYLSDQERYIMVYRLNDIIDMDIFLDKFRTYEKFQDYYQREAISIEHSSDSKKFLEFTANHSIFVQKKVSLSKGNSVQLIDIQNINMSPEEYFNTLISDGKYILEERVLQSRVMAKLNESSVNTVRCITFFANNEIKIGPCFLKVGRLDSFVDNGGAGGILVGIDNSTGRLSTNGFDEFLKEYTSHPDNGTKFAGYQLPDWEDMIRTVKSLSKEIPSVRYIGWDMAHTNSGWIVIEGNSSGQMIGPQIVFKQGFKQCIIDLFK